MRGQLHRRANDLKLEALKSKRPRPIAKASLFITMTGQRYIEPEPKHPQQRPDAKFGIGGLARDVWSTEDEATATCFCGQVQIVIVRLLSLLGAVSTAAWAGADSWLLSHSRSPASSRPSSATARTVAKSATACSRPTLP